MASGGSGTAAFAQGWESYPWITVGAGYENDRLLQQGAVPIVVPGGSFLDIRPGLLLSRTVGERTRLNFDAVASFERFNNDDSRRLFGGALNGEVRQRFGAIGRWRLTIGANYFGDSVQDGVNRFRLGGEAALGVTGRRGFGEILLGLQGRRFPDLVSPDATGTLGTYTEYGPSAGITGAWRPVRRVELSGFASYQGTIARDPDLDSRTLFLQAGMRAYLIGPLQGFASALAQEREFTAGIPGADTDNYRQLGLGLAYPLGRSFDIVGRYARAEYTDMVGNTDDIERYSVAVTWWPGGRGIRSLPDPAFIRLDEFDQDRVYAGEAHRFRVKLGGAQAVSVVGDFNGWQPASMHPSGGGWWEADIVLPAGSHQYAYLVDGALVAPPEALVTVDDGFGGRNGLITVELRSP